MALYRLSMHYYFFIHFINEIKYSIVHSTHPQNLTFSISAFWMTISSYMNISMNPLLYLLIYFNSRQNFNIFYFYILYKVSDNNCIMRPRARNNDDKEQGSYQLVDVEKWSLYRFSIQTLNFDGVFFLKSRVNKYLLSIYYHFSYYFFNF